MKKRILVFMLSLLFILPTAVCLTACTKTTYCISVECNNKSMGQVYGGGEYSKDETVVVVAVANDGYKFTEWSDGEKNPVREVKVSSSRYFYANFEKITPAEEKYVLDSVNIHLSDIETKVDAIYLEKLSLSRSSTDTLTCVDYEGGEYTSYYKGEHGLIIYNENNGYNKQYTSQEPLTIYAPRNEFNNYSQEEYVYIKYEAYESYDDSTSQTGAGGGSQQSYVQIDPTSTSNVFELDLNNSKMYVKLNFVKV